MASAFAVCCAAVWLVAGGAAAAQPLPGVSVFPIPGSRVATPQTQISFRGVQSAQLEAATIQVTGSRTGPHSGKVEADSDGNGGSFIPAMPFQAGETVTVTTSLTLVDSTKG